MKWQRQLIFLGGLMLVVILGGCSSQDSSEPAVEPLAVTIEGHDIRYEPQKIEARAGQPVHLTFANHGSQEHDVTFDMLPVAEEEVHTIKHEHEEEAEHSHEEEAEHTHDEETQHTHEEEAEHADDHEEEAMEEGEHMHEDAAMHVHTVAGEEVTVLFTPTEPGTYEFYCSVPGHRDAGMIGTLTVTE